MSRYTSVHVLWQASSAPGARGLWFPEFAYALRARQLAEKPIRSRQETAGQQRPAFDPELGAADLDYAGLHYAKSLTPLLLVTDVPLNEDRILCNSAMKISLVWRFLGPGCNLLNLRIGESFSLQLERQTPAHVALEYNTYNAICQSNCPRNTTSKQCKRLLINPIEEDGYDRGGYDDFAGPPSDDDEGDVTGVTDGVLGVDVAAEWAELASSGAVTLTLDVDGKGAAPMTYEELCQVTQPLARAHTLEVLCTR